MALNLVKGDIRTQLDELPESNVSSPKEEADVVNGEGKDLPLGMEERNWAELPRDILLVIFKKIAAIGILRSAQFVCRPWRQLSYKPELWRCIDMRSKPQPLNTTDLGSIVMAAVDRSDGCLEELYVRYFWSDALMGYIADRATHLRCFHLISICDVSAMSLIQAVRRFLLLEDLQIYFCSFSEEDIESVCQACPQLKSFSFNTTPNELFYYIYVPGCDTIALAIAKHMHQLRRLQLFGNLITNVGLVAILNSCPYLVCLDVRCCPHIDPNENLKKKCSRIMNIRFPNDSIDEVSGLTFAGNAFFQYDCGAAIDALFGGGEANDFDCESEYDTRDLLYDFLCNDVLNLKKIPTRNKVGGNAFALCEDIFKG